MFLPCHASKRLLLRPPRPYLLHGVLAKSTLSPSPDEEEVANKISLFAQELSSSFRCNVLTARAIFRRRSQCPSKLLSLGIEDLRETLEFCETANVRLRDVIENPVIVTMSSKILSERLSCLMELGLRNIQATHILNFNYIMAQTPNKLRQYKALKLPKEESHIQLEHLVSGSPEFQSAVKSKILTAYSKNSTLASIKAELNTAFLAWRLKCPHETVEKFMKKHSSLKSVSIKGIESTIDVLIRDYGLDPSKISHSLFILASDSRKFGSLFRNVQNILGVDIQVIIQKLPAVIGRTAESLKKVEEVLLEFYSSSEQLMSCPKVLLMNPSTLRHRLRGLHESEDFRLLKNNKDFLWLAIHHKWLNYRLKFLKSSGVPCSMSVFLLSPVNFKKRMKLSKGSTYGKDVVRYFAEIFQCNEGSVRNHIQDYPNMSCTSILNAVKVIEFLLSRGVSKEQLWNGLGIVAYDLETVEKYFNNMPYYKEFQPFSDWKGHFNLIHLLIYAIERNSSCAVDLIPKDKLHNVEEMEEEESQAREESFSDTREFYYTAKDNLTDFYDNQRHECISDDESDEELSNMYMI